MSKKNSFNNVIRIINNNIKEENAQIILDNMNLVEEWNSKIEKEFDDIKKFHKKVDFKKFDYEKYYDSKKEKLVINEYNPLPIPDEIKLKKQIKYLKKNILLEKIFKDRTNKRKISEKKFKDEWKKLNDDYEKRESKHLKAYDENKKNKIIENEKFNNEIAERKEKFVKGDMNEVLDCIGEFLNKSNFENYSIGCKKINVIANEKKNNIMIDYLFEIPSIIVPDIKRYKYLKTKNEAKPIYYSLQEKEELFENIVFNSAFYYTSMITYAFLDKINEVIVNCYVNDVNLATGNYEDKYIMTAIFDPKLINFNDFNLINSKKFFDYVGAKYNVPLINLNKIILPQV